MPENSLPAFRLAAEQGYGIELDVQRTADGALVVFHDATAERMCGVKRRISGMTLAEVRSLRLDGTGEGVPTLAEVLDAVDGRVPLIVELKQTPYRRAMVSETLTLLREKGCVFLAESFDPRLLAHCRRMMPEVPRGQLGFGLRYAEKASVPARLLMAGRLSCLLSRPDVLVWDLHTCGTPWFRLLQCLHRYPLLLWTVRTDAERAEAERLGIGWIGEFAK